MLSMLIGVIINQFRCQGHTGAQGHGGCGGMRKARNEASELAFDSKITEDETLKAKGQERPEMVFMDVRVAPPCGYHPAPASWQPAWPAVSLTRTSPSCMCPCLACPPPACVPVRTVTRSQEIRNRLALAIAPSGKQYMELWEAMPCHAQCPAMHDGLPYTMACHTRCPAIHDGLPHTMACHTRCPAIHDGLPYTMPCHTRWQPQLRHLSL